MTVPALAARTEHGPAATMIRKVALFCAFATAAFLASQWHRLIPESSPAARGAAAVNSQGCIECHGQSEPGFPDDVDLSCTNVGVNSTHPRYDGLCSDVLAYFEIVRLKRTFDVRARSVDQNPMLQGEILARQYNCFQCHGEMGQGGFRNAGALKGYIPGYFGNDFALLTRGGSAESVRNWIG